ncbi:tetratricopeptide repeat protein [Rhodanobacter sp. L36]|uniref:tetratricopeptide repeat protein n=1 Tax=Rhodanobacter sp. L36 TaxID=1747221 RepID=UPI00131CE30B|nr:tetratricopeptide repeat protein [Rhodanobacter sp. L36]
MTSHGRVVLITGLVILGIVGCCWIVSDIAWRTSQATHVAQAQRAGQAARSWPPPRPAFTPDEVRAFLAKVRSAEAIADPLQRCVSYPDPPRSHWSPESAKAYCLYYLQQTITFDEAEKLIEHGQAAELDRRLAQELQAQLTRPDSHGLLDHTYFASFNDGSFDVRETLDAWKRASPSSAFAFAASGSAYVAMASKARGGAYINETPQSNIDAMDRLLQQADTDLQRAAKLDPKVTPTYVAMINAGSMSLGGDYLRRAAQAGLAAAPDNYAIYGTLSGATEPRWGGSLAAMDHMARQAQAYVKQNPLLAILLSAEPAYRYDVCNCRSSADWSMFPTVFDNVSSVSLLSYAGGAASEQNHFDLAAIYLSEVLRFQPGAEGARRQRDVSLPAFGETAMALDDASRLIAADPLPSRNFRARADIYMSMGKVALAEKDLEQALAIDPDDIDVLVPLGDLYANQTYEWDKAWHIADRIIQKYPNSPAGWMTRATIQENQPRAGLADTLQHVVEHFGHDPSMQWQINRMREVLARGPRSAPSFRASKNH